VGTIKGASKSSYFHVDADDDRVVIITDPSHRLYDKRVELPIDPSMVESIADPNVGMIEPVVVRKVGDEYQVVDGRQRVRAARAAKEKYPERKIRIKMLPQTLTDYYAAVQSSIANTQRVDDSAIIKGRNAKRMKEMGAEDGELVTMFGVELRTIQQWMKLSEDASEELETALNAGEITLTSALKISKKPAEKQADALEKARSNGIQKPGPKKGTKRQRKIRIVATETDGGIDVEVSNCTDVELATIIEKLEGVLNGRKPV
jgi:ParB family chromosome partitioning protein